MLHSTKILVVGLLCVSLLHVVAAQQMVMSYAAIVKGQQQINQEIRTVARAGKAELLKELLKQCATINAQDAQGRTALMYAFYYENIDCAQVLLSAKADYATIRDEKGLSAEDYAKATDAMQQLMEQYKKGIEAYHIITAEESKVPQSQQQPAVVTENVATWSCVVS